LKKVQGHGEGEGERRGSGGCVLAGGLLNMAEIHDKIVKKKGAKENVSKKKKSYHTGSTPWLARFAKKKVSQNATAGEERRFRLGAVAHAKGLI